MAIACSGCGDNRKLAGDARASDGRAAMDVALTDSAYPDSAHPDSAHPDSAHLDSAHLDSPPDVGPDTDSLAPSLHDFGAVPLPCPPGPQMFMVTNTGTTTHGPITTALEGANASEFAIENDGCTGQMLAPSIDCTLSVAYEPAVVGSALAQLVVTSSPSVSVEATVLGSAVIPAPISISPASLSFPDTQMGQTSATQDVTVTNNTDCSPTGPIYDSLAGANPSQFTVTADTCAGVALVSSASCTITLAFAPTTTGSQSATLAVAASPGGSVIATMSGSGL